MSKQRKAIVVLGMHRSGTSAITRILNLMGFALPEHLMPSVEENNETGFWESSALAEIHDRLLDDVGSAWDDCLRFPVEFYGSDTARAYSREILATLESEFPGHTDLVIKDPRICRFLPFWLDLLDTFGARPLLVLISRHPLEVAASLRRRDHFPEARSLHLWLRHMLDMERDSRNLPRSLITYDGLLRDWRSTVESIGTDLDVTWPRSANDVESAVGGFLSDSLRHHTFEEAAGHSAVALYDWVFEVQSAFERAAREGASLDGIFDRVDRDLAAAEAVFSPAMGAVQASLRDTDRHQKTALERAHARDREVYEAEIRKNRQLLEEFDSKVRRQQARMDAMGETHFEDRRKYEAEVGKLRSVLDEDSRKYETEIGKLRTVLEESDAKVYSLRDELERTVSDKDWVWDRWHETKAELQAIQTSKVGRVLWGQWRLYLGLRRRLLKARQILSRRPSDAADGQSPITEAGPSGLLRAALRWPTRLAGRGIGLAYLSGAVASEQVKASLRSSRHSSAEASPHRVSGKQRQTLPKVLLVSPYPIYPPDHGGGVRLFNLIQRVAAHSHLHLLVFSQSGEDADQRQALSEWAESVHFHHWQPQISPSGLHLEPPNAGLFASDQAARQIAHLLASEGIDILQLEYAELGQFGRPDFARVKVVLTEHDLAFRQHWRRRRMGFHSRFPEGNAYGSSIGDWLRLTRYELDVCRRAHQIHVMSEVDGRALSAFMADGRDRIRVVPNAVDSAYYAPPATSTRNRDVLYVGNFQNLPNVDALEYLVAEIWPQVRATYPDLGLTVAGANPSSRVSRFHGQDGITVVGGVPDLRPYYHQHRLMVAPIRAGSGTRLKILEAFASGLPVVSTTLGAEGIEAVPGEHLLVADDARSLAEAMLSLLEDDALATRLSENALALACERYDWQHSADRMLQGWHELLRDDRPVPSVQPAATTSERAVASEPIPEVTEIDDPTVDVSIIIPTFHGGEDLSRCLAAISRQATDLTYEILCVDSSSDDVDAATMESHGARVIPIAPAEFDHGLTRDLGATHSRGRILVFLNQDATPGDESWLTRLTQPLLADERCAAVQGGINEVSDPQDRFFWDSCGERFYFTRESDRWIERYFGIGFSTVNAAIRRSVWSEHRFGAAPIMEDKRWQKRVVEAGHVIRLEPEAAVTHTHNYALRPLWRRCSSEGFGWRLVGESYSLADMVRDGCQLRVHRDLIQGLAQGKVRSSAELLFPWLRPFALYWGNHWSRSVKL